MINKFDPVELGPKAYKFSFIILISCFSVFVSMRRRLNSFTNFFKSFISCSVKDFFVYSINIIFRISSFYYGYSSQVVISLKSNPTALILTLHFLFYKIIVHQYIKVAILVKNAALPLLRPGRPV